MHLTYTIPQNFIRLQMRPEQEHSSAMHRKNFEETKELDTMAIRAHAI